MPFSLCLLQAPSLVTPCLIAYPAPNNRRLRYNMTNPWQIWMQTITQACEGATQSQNPALTAYTQLCQQWANASSNAWQMPSEFWQTVSAIQTSRARSISQFWQQQPQEFSAFMNAQTVPQACGQFTQWCGNNAIQAINLAVTTQAFRANLLQQWSRACQPVQPQNFSTPQTTGNLWSEPSSNNSSSSSSTGSTGAASQAQNKSSRTASSASASASSQQATATVSAPWHMQSHYPTQHITQAKVVAAASKPAVQTQAVAAQQTQAPVSQQSSLLNGTTGTVATVSSTANSVMRTNGSSITAAAATRRSVVARRATNRRRMVPRTVR